MTSLLPVFLASLLDLKNRTLSILRLGPGMPLSGRKQTKKLLKQAPCAAALRVSLRDIVSGAQFPDMPLDCDFLRGINVLARDARIVYIHGENNYIIN